MTRRAGFSRGNTLMLGTALLLAFVLPEAPAAHAEEAPLHIAAAADLMPVLPALARSFTKKTGIPVRISWGASGEEAQAIRHGAPYDLFMAADRSFPDKLAKGGYLQKASLKVYAKGILVLWVSKKTLDRAHALPGTEVLSSPFVHRIALANPRLAPYGRAAMSCLRSRKLLSSLHKKIVYGNSLAQAAQYLRTGAAQSGFLSESQAMVLGRLAKGDFVALSPHCSPWLPQEMGIVSASKNKKSAKAFEEYLLGAKAQGYLMKHGYHG